jgi:hypothetical protein
MRETLRDREWVDPATYGYAMRDLRGKWGRLSALIPFKPPVGMKRTQMHWLCRCECGEFIIVQGDKLIDGYRLACTAQCFERAVTEFAELTSTTYEYARTALITRTLSPVVAPASSRIRVNKGKMWQLPPGHREPNPAGTGRRMGETIPALMRAVEIAWSLTGVPGECTVGMRGKAWKQRRKTRDGYAVHWQWRARVTRLSDGSSLEGKPANTIHAAMILLLKQLSEDRETR